MHATLLHIAQIVKGSSGVSRKLLRIIFTAKDIEIFLATYARSFFLPFFIYNIQRTYGRTEGQTNKRTDGSK